MTYESSKASAVIASAARRLWQYSVTCGPEQITTTIVITTIITTTTTAATTTSINMITTSTITSTTSISDLRPRADQASLSGISLRCQPSMPQ